LIGASDILLLRRVAVQAVNGSVLRDATKLAEALQQDIGMIRLALLQDPAAAAAAAAASSEDLEDNSKASSRRLKGAGSVGSNQQQQTVCCYLLPPELPSSMQLEDLATKLGVAVEKAARSGWRTSSNIVQCWIETFRLCKLQEQQPQWQQQRRPAGELLLQDISVTRLGKRGARDNVIAKAEELLERVRLLIAVAAAQFLCACMFVHTSIPFYWLQAERHQHAGSIREAACLQILRSSLQESHATLRLMCVLHW
jgi:hypothetical protein